jgi:hypothetical protein
MNGPKFLLKAIGVMLAVLSLAGCGSPAATPAQSPTLPPPPTPAQPTAQSLVNDFTPCFGAPSGQTNTPARGRALMAHSTNGLDFRRPANPKDGILIDRAGVPDGVVLPGGRILVYFIDGCRPYDGTQKERSAVAVAVSDRQGAPGSWIFKNVRFINVPTTEGFGSTIVDPNVVLLPDGGLRLFATMFRPVAGSTRLGAYSFSSTDGGFTYSFEGMRYDDIADPENYRFGDSNWQIITGGPRGYAMSADGGNTFNTLGSFPTPQGAVHEIAVTDKPGEYRTYASTPTGIKSFVSTASPWTKWTEEAGYRLQVDSTTGLESCEVAVPTVLRLGPGNYLMVYLTVIPGCGCQEDPICP